jgi:hypothetical protein
MNKNTFSAICDGTLDKAQMGELVAHLSHDCECCDQFFLDDVGSKELLLSALVENLHQKRDNSFSFSAEIKERIFNAITHQASRRSGWQGMLPDWKIPIPAYPTLAAILVAITTIFYFQWGSPPQTPSGIKGDTKIFSLLTAQYTLEMDGRPQVQGPVSKNMVLSSKYDLLFSFTITRPGNVYLTRYFGKESQVIYPSDFNHPTLWPKGEHDLTIDNQLVTYSLAELVKQNIAGQISFCSFLSPVPLSQPSKIIRNQSSCVEIELTR